MRHRAHRISTQHGVSEPLILFNYHTPPSPLSSPAHLLVEGHTQLKQLGKSSGKVLEECLLVLGVQFNVLSELLVLQQGHVGRQHHQSAIFGLQLCRARPRLAIVGFLGGPGLVQQCIEIFVTESGLGSGPGAPVTRSILVASAYRVSSQQCHDLPVVEAHAAKNVPHVGVGGTGAAHVRIGQTTVRQSCSAGSRGSSILAARPPGDLGTTHLLDGHHSSQSPSISNTQAGMLLHDSIDEISGHF
mmetsp:Transcript_35978/g.61975  ORF Transcript_35978/g.61975 Transcript_35978/m.61975 type:complete len:245 (+) Transcript_35978:89-823(+)